MHFVAHIRYPYHTSFSCEIQEPFPPPRTNLNLVSCSLPLFSPSSRVKLCTVVMAGCQTLSRPRHKRERVGCTGLALTLARLERIYHSLELSLGEIFLLLLTSLRLSLFSPSPLPLPTPTHREWLQEAYEHCNVSNFEVYLVATKRDLVVSQEYIQ